MNTIEALLQSINLEEIEENIFRGTSHDVGSPHVFGGQVLSQALHAAILTVPKDRFVHSLHAYFILPGDLERPIVFQVERLRNGGSFTTRRVTAIQNGKAIFNFAASFQVDTEGYDHQIEIPDVPSPDTLQSDQDLLKAFKSQLPKQFQRFIRPLPIEFRPVNPFIFITPEKQEPIRYVWMKAKGDVPNIRSIHQRILAYASDYNLLTTAIQPHQHKTSFTKLQIASLDHAMWFHRDFKIDEWLLYAIDSPSASSSRGFTRGNIYKQDGTLVASVVQEGLMRQKRDRKKKEDDEKGS